MKSIFLKWLSDSDVVVSMVKSINDLTSTVEKLLVVNKEILEREKQMLDREAQIQDTLTKMAKLMLAMDKDSQEQSKLLLTLYAVYDELSVALGAAPGTTPSTNKKDAYTALIEAAKTKDAKGTNGGGKSN